MEVREAHPVWRGREGVDVRRVDLAAETAWVGEAEVVGYDEQEVGPFALGWV